MKLEWRKDIELGLPWTEHPGLVALTYKIIGGDGQEYGGASDEDLRAWIREGRVAPDTQVWRSDDERWLPAAERPELFEALARHPAHTAFRAATEDALRAGFWIRAAALAFDLLLLGVLIRFVATPPEVLLNPPQEPTELMRALSAEIQTVGAYLAIQFILGALYFTLLTGQFGGSLGKLMLGLRVERVDGAPLGFGTAFGRFLAAQLSQLLCLGGYLLAVVRRDRRALHDLMAGTRVVYRRELFGRED